MDDNYPSNSRSAQTKKVAQQAEPKAQVEKSEKKIEQITVNSVVRRKKPLGKRFAESFMGGDAQSVGAYIVADVLLPAAKDMVADAVSQGIEKMLFGEARAPRSRGAVGNRGIGGSTSHVSYNRYSGNSQTRPQGPKPVSARARATHDFDEIILSTRAEADEVLDNLFNLVSEYDFATVADLYGMVGVTGSYTDEKWGWSDIRGTSVTRVKGGYLLDLPRPQYID
ncbi:hypothetical protein SEA_AFLAC_56 [Gordonia phage Aflac]|uniref:Uncharacterized protein n=2 Tax=Kenoshavirus TaxID=2842796 RepID=A0A410TCL0_9CAUD|nr:hypothetical protein HWC06_gp55 [Gordonia phage Duffington]YP_009852157.1 hypothetical protein HWC66_gp55 [Gordonia phage Chikenjars]QKY79447.1 hypothetical protein SEA_JODELIE19_56 [Gordonia phage Jodelie19]QWY82388.1 hypothetical protein SEA_AFLAC_56 [Gordonia phage Aflac]QXO13062.1 hypothetical protein SEA_FIGLIAR_55 [Gordonia phage Figliar]QXO14080.1 hypothetical protein SEA_ALAINAMARIE_56 [Gordonia phage AlainaMarie]WNN94378.1 hypothetical protein SEA_ENDAVE_58 [Gordonia phage EndAve]